MAETTTQLSLNVQTLELGNYLIDLVKVADFKKYYYQNLDNFSKVAYNSYLKAVDIPPKFFKENPIETQELLLDNREVFVKEHKKYFDKVIVVARVKIDGNIVNACRMTLADALASYERLKTINQVVNKFEHRSFQKDGYISYIISYQDIKSNADNKVLAVDFPILLNKKAIIHRALYTLPNETFVTPIEHIHYVTSEEVDFAEYADIKSAIESHKDFFENDLNVGAPKDVLREPEVVALALAQAGTISNSYIFKVAEYIKENSKGTLTTDRLESLVLDYDETFRSYKQVTALRSVCGYQVLKILESPDFQELTEEMKETLDILNEE